MLIFCILFGTLFIVLGISSNEWGFPLVGVFFILIAILAFKQNINAYIFLGDDQIEFNLVSITRTIKLHEIQNAFTNIVKVTERVHRKDEPDTIRIVEKKLFVLILTNDEVIDLDFYSQFSEKNLEKIYDYFMKIGFDLRDYQYNRKV